MPGDQQSMKHVLAIDLGTGGPKVGLVSQAGEVVSSARASVALTLLPDGGAEHDPAQWWSSIVRCVRQVMDATRLAPDDVIAVGVTSMWSVTLPVDEAGQPLMNAVSWMDRRGARYNRELVKGFPSIQGYRLGLLLKYLDLVGFPPILKGVDALGHMLFIKNSRPDVYARTYKFLEPMDYVNLRLTGKFAATQNTALPTMMVDNRRLNNQRYDSWLLKTGGIEAAKLPDLLPVDGIIGALLPEAARELGLSPKTVVICGVNDNSSSAIGAGALFDVEPAAVLGTSGYLACHVPFKKTDLGASMGSMPSGIKDRYLFWGELQNNGSVYDSYLKNLLYAQDCVGAESVPEHVYARADEEVKGIAAGSDGVLFLPWFNGIGSPGDDPHMRGGFLNLSHKTTRAHLTRAVLEGLAMNWRWLRGPSERFVGRAFQTWRLTGGGALSDAWSQIMADVVGLPMRRQVNPRYSNVLGIGLLGFQRLGLIRLEDIPNMIKFDRVFTPSPENRAVYDRMYAQFLASKNRTRPVFHALNKV